MRFKKMGVWFDMDGTIADLYGVENWLPMILNGEVAPYENARPLVNMSRLARVLNRAQRNGVEIGIVSWCCRGGSAEYNEAVANAKREWLRRHLPSVHWDRIEIVEYGVAKNEIASGILFDDEIANRENWGCGAYAPEEMWEVLAEM